MDSSTRSKFYRAMYRDIRIELSEQIKAQRAALESEGVTLDVFKAQMAELLVISGYRPKWSALFRYYCERRTIDAGLSIPAFAEFYFGRSTISKNGVRLKSKPDERL